MAALFVLMAATKGSGQIATSSSVDAVDSATIALTVDSARREVRIEVGPFVFPAITDSAEHAHATTQTLDFTWPINGWVRGFRIQLTRSNGQPVSDVLHHMHVINYDRRQLIYPIFERLLAASGETNDVEVPAVIGVPMAAGQRLGVFLALNAERAQHEELYAKLTIVWTPDTQQPTPFSLIPAVIDVHDVLSSTYDLPAGQSRKTFDFEVPIAGRVVLASGHLHDYGESLELQEAATARTLFKIGAHKTAEGRLTGMERAAFWPIDKAPRLEPGVQYRLVATYDNITGRPLRASAMGMLVVGFLPDNPGAWPPVDLKDPMLQRDLRALKGERHRH